MKRREASGMAAAVLGLITLILLGLAYYGAHGVPCTGLDCAPPAPQATPTQQVTNDAP